MTASVGLSLVLGLTAACGVSVGTSKDTAATPDEAPDGATVTASASPEPGATPTPTATPTAPAQTATRGPLTPFLPESGKPAPVDLSDYDMPGFTTPSGNIGCLFDDYNGGHVRCDRLAMDSVPGGKPDDCDFDWGHSVELSAGGRGALACTSDSVMGLPGETDGSRSLPYGDSVYYRGITCTSTTTSLRCRTGGGHGFLLSRAVIRVR